MRISNVNWVLIFLEFWQIGHFEEAEKAKNAGVDAIIVQGHEAGGHVIGLVWVYPITFLPNFSSIQN